MTITSNMRGVKRHPISEAVKAVLKEAGYDEAAKVDPDHEKLYFAKEELSEAIEQLAKVKQESVGEVLKTLREAHEKLSELCK